MAFTWLGGGGSQRIHVRGETVKSRAAHYYAVPLLYYRIGSSKSMRLNTDW